MPRGQCSLLSHEPLSHDYRRKKIGGSFVSGCEFSFLVRNRGQIFRRFYSFFRDRFDQIYSYPSSILSNRMFRSSIETSNVKSLLNRDSSLDQRNCRSRKPRTESKIAEGESTNKPQTTRTDNNKQV